MKKKHKSAVIADFRPRSYRSVRKVVGAGQKKERRKSSIYNNPKRETTDFTPFKRALDENANRRFLPQPNGFKLSVTELKPVQNTGYLTDGTFLDRIKFENPKRVTVCHRRKERRRALFALKLTGKGSASKNHRWTSDSSVSCKG